MEHNETKKANSPQRQQRRKILVWAGIVTLVFILAVMPVLAANKDAALEQQASILSGRVEYGSIDTQIIGGGQLASEAAIKLEIPEEVKLTEYLVGNGDTVLKGDPIAKVDRVSVMTAITGVQETLNELSKEIADAENDTATGTVKASAGGRVKVIWAEAGESAQDVMLEHGALAAISLDDVMAVKIQRVSDLDAGDHVCVILPEGTEVDGRVEQNLEGVLTVTVEDKGYDVGMEVTVRTEDGDRLGKGPLYIFNQWNAVSYSGTVSGVLVTEGASLYSGQPLFQLQDSGHTAEFQRLIDKRHEYEQLMQELFRMYRTEAIAAPCDGIVSGVDKNGAFLLSDKSDGFLASLLTAITGRRKDSFAAYGVQVQSVSGENMVMQVSSGCTYVEDPANLSAISVNTKYMGEIWDYAGDTTVYVQSEDGLLRADGTAQPGDLLLAVGNAERVLWFVRAQASESSEAGSRNMGQVVLLGAIERDTTAAVTLHLSNTQGTAKETFSATLKATRGDTVLSGIWSIESSSFSMDVYGDMIYGTPLQAGEYSVTVGFVPADTEEYIRATFTLAIAAPYEIITTEIPAGTVGKAYSFTMEVSGSEGGKWGYENLPAGLVLDEKTGEISGEPTMTGTFEVTITYTDEQKGQLTHLYEVVISEEQTSDQENGTPGTSEGMGGMSGGGMSGRTPSGSMSGSMVQEEDSYYSLEKLIIASVTSQEHMTVEVTIDELDISKIFVGQPATVTMEALSGETFAATVTKIANSGESEGGNSKFTVELTLEKSGDMLPGMTASVTIVLDTLENILCIPAAALSEENGKPVVYTSYDSEKGMLGTPVEVTIGAADADNVQILSALEAGSEFYYAYYDTLATTGMPERGPRPFG